MCDRDWGRSQVLGLQRLRPAGHRELEHSVQPPECGPRRYAPTFCFSTPTSSWQYQSLTIKACSILQEQDLHASNLTSSLSGYSAVAIALGNIHTCVIVSGGVLKCWGYNGNGQLGIGSSSNRYSPVDVSLGSGIATGARKQCLVEFIIFSSIAFCTLPSPLSGYSAVSIALGQHHTCAIVTGGGVKCWGYNDYGQLGIGSSSSQYSPVDVGLGGMPRYFSPQHDFQGRVLALQVCWVLVLKGIFRQK